MERHFDAHLYLSNFGCRQWHLRLPRESVDLKEVRRYELKEALEIRETPTHVIFSFLANDEGGGDYDEFDENPSGVLGAFLPLREALAEGDMRPLYIAWLAGIQNGGVPGNVGEPPVPPGLGKADGTLEGLAKFLWLRPALLQAAARQSGEVKKQRFTTESMRRWVRNLSVADKETWLFRLLEEPTRTPGTDFRRAFANSQPKAVSADTSPPRTVAQLLADAEALAELQREAAAREAAAKRAEEARKAGEQRRRYLQTLRRQEASMWRSIFSLTAASAPTGYNTAVKKLVDLRDLAEMTGQADVFKEKLNELRELRHRKPSLLERMKQAGLDEVGRSGGAVAASELPPLSHPVVPVGDGLRGIGIHPDT